MPTSRHIATETQITYLTGIRRTGDMTALNRRTLGPRTLTKLKTLFQVRASIPFGGIYVATQTTCIADSNNWSKNSMPMVGLPRMSLM
eukprot:5551038-Pyramimonas_sp.AAC.1